MNLDPTLGRDVVVEEAMRALADVRAAARARALSHYSGIAAETREPQLLETLAEARAALIGFTEWVSNLGDTMSFPTARLYRDGLTAIERIDTILPTEDRQL